MPGSTRGRSDKKSTPNPAAPVLGRKGTAIGRIPYETCSRSDMPVQVRTEKNPPSAPGEVLCTGGNLDERNIVSGRRYGAHGRHRSAKQKPRLRVFASIDMARKTRIAGDGTGIEFAQWKLRSVAGHRNRMEKFNRETACALRYVQAFGPPEGPVRSLVATESAPNTNRLELYLDDRKDEYRVRDLGHRRTPQYGIVLKLIGLGIDAGWW
ncbi:hypothetical protein N7492_007377 [Penicillium capsulatum]|uniref:Uncharacterized protein n=1 Tax=Penicillium capsulatum TaxID=69766 RepID=A0A9W9I3P7_9EURO|nr:hypothetical protein N7492_007377 [Penicillium capsulatum]